MTPRTARPARRACSARRPASAGGQPPRGRPTSTSISTSPMPACAAAATVSSESTATVTRAPRVASSARAARRFRSSSSLASSRSVPSPAPGHADELACGRPAERGVPGGGQLAGQRGGLERLHVRTQRGAGPHRRHGRHVVLERVGVDHERGRGQVVDVHDRARYVRSRRPSAFWGRICAPWAHIRPRNRRSSRERRGCRRRESNPHWHGPKPCASANWATPAGSAPGRR